MLDPESIDAMSKEEQTDLLSWLQDLAKYVKTKLGVKEDEKETVTTNDPVGDVIVLDHKKNQAKASLGRKASGWMSTGFDKVDDKHV